MTAGAMMVDDPELDALRRRRAQEIQAQAAAQQDAAARQAEFEAAKAQVLWQVLTPEARERLAALRMARPDFAAAVENQLVTLAQQGRLGAAPLTDDVLKQILARMTAGRRDINIERR